ncbi:hypothetical protein FB451DRAFT_1170286 [Mycena latifolia]|nr:hypothetical protein FB451DRAFT_1170286 [Mycena latifolia]
MGRYKGRYRGGEEHRTRSRVRSGESGHNRWCLKAGGSKHTGVCRLECELNGKGAMYAARGVRHDAEAEYGYNRPEWEEQGIESREGRLVMREECENCGGVRHGGSGTGGGRTRIRVQCGSSEFKKSQISACDDGEGRPGERQIVHLAHGLRERGRGAVAAAGSSTNIDSGSFRAGPLWHKRTELVLGVKEFVAGGRRHCLGVRRGRAG